MISKRNLVIIALLTVPVLIYLGVGGYALWQTGLLRWTWWLIPGCWLVTYGLTKLWPSQPFKTDDVPLPTHWTPQDEAAMRIVNQFQAEIHELAPEDLTDLQFYFQQAQRLAASLAKHYHPKSKEIYASLTVLEVLAAIRLAVEDIEDWFQQSVPGSHLVTIQQWKLLGKAPKWVKRASEAGWLASIALNPANIAKYFSSKLTLTPIAEGLRTEFLAAVYLRYIRQVGFYLVEMNSGRLRRGAKRYRSTFGSGPEMAAKSPESSDRSITPESVTVAVIGQVKAGKSSVVNALIGKRSAVTDVLPATKAVHRYRLAIPESNESIVLLDTPGYQDAGATRVEIKQLEQAVELADVVLIVVDAHTPGRDADVQMIHQMRENAERRPELKRPPIVVCMTHIDLLSPMMEWEPPYDWSAPDRAKEFSIAAALNSVRETFKDTVVEVVAVCSDVDRSRVDNVQEGLIPALASVLESGKMVALLKAYESSLDSDRFSSVVDQLKSSGRDLLNVWIQERLSPRKEI